MQCRMTRARRGIFTTIKWVPAHQVPTKQLMPTVPAFMKEMRCYWNKPFCHRVPIKGYTGLEIADSEILELTKPLVVEQLVAFQPP